MDKSARGQIYGVKLNCVMLMYEILNQKVCVNSKHPTVKAVYMARYMGFLVSAIWQLPAQS